MGYYKNLELEREFSLPRSVGKNEDGEEEFIGTDQQWSNKDKLDDLGSCMCGKCEVELKCEHSQDENHEISICGKCAG